MEVKKKIILEISKRKFIIRKLVSDVINVYKQNEEGEFLLPEDLDGQHVYEFPKLKNPIQVELTIFPDDEIETFIVDADYFDEEGIIAITIIYNPEEKIKIIYDLIGELNEIIAHELRHNYQHLVGMFEFDPEEMKKSEEDPVKYYTQPHELDAQVYGFTRLAKLRKVPFEDVVRNWFETHKEIHQMNDQDVDFVIGKIIETKRNN
jgi:hypothetical protein